MKLARCLALRAANSCAILVFSHLQNIILLNRGLGLYLDNYIFSLAGSSGVGQPGGGWSGWHGQ